jgi:hypothetical protein
MRTVGLLAGLALVLVGGLGKPAQAQVLCPQGEYRGYLACVEPRAGVPVQVLPGPVQVPADGGPVVVPSWDGRWIAYVTVDPTTSTTPTTQSYRIINVPGPWGQPTPAVCLPSVQVGNTLQLLCSLDNVIPPSS